jgi:hypothetical protein
MPDTLHPHEVKPPAAVLMEDVICQSFIQSSSTLAYACLLIRQKRYDMATHVLHSLEAKQASRFKDMVFYLQTQIGIETGDFAAVKRRLAPRVHQHPNDMVSLSLLEACVFQEWDAWQVEQPREDTPRPASPAPAKTAISSESEEPLQAAGREAPHAGPERHLPEPAPETYRTAKLSAGEILPQGGAPGTDIGPFQGVAADEHTLALALWNSKAGRVRSVCRKLELEPLVAMLPEAVPNAIAEACDLLEGGEIHKICFCFQHLTVTSFHAGAENLGLLTGSLNHSLLTMVRAENIFLKYAPVGGADSPVREGTRPAVLKAASDE